MTPRLIGPLTALALVCSSAAYMSAQDRNSPPTRAGGSPETQAAPRPDSLTLNGCLDRAPDGTYQLTHARLAPLASTGAPETSGTAGTSGRAVPDDTRPSPDRPRPSSPAPVTEVPQTWILKSASDLAPHVGHQVEVIGRPSAPYGTSGSNTATTATPDTTATGARMKRPGDDAHSVEVQGVRMISRACVSPAEP